MPIFLTTINILVRNKQDILLQSSHFFQVPICSEGGFPAPAFAYLPPHSVHKKDCLNSWHSFSVLPFRSSWTSRAKISANFNHVLHTVPASGVKKNFKRPTEISAWSKMARCPSRWEWVILEKKKGVVLRKMGPGLLASSRGLISSSPSLPLVEFVLPSASHLLWASLAEITHL